MSERVKLPREIWVLVAAAVAISLGYGIVAPVLPQFAKAFGVTTTAATVVVSAFAFMRLAFAPVSGRLSGRFGERRMYLSGITIVAISSAASAFSESYWQLLIVRALGGAGSVMFTVAAMSLVIKMAPPHARGRASAAYGSGFLVGNITGPALGGVLAPLGYRWPFIIYAVMLLISVLFVAWAIPAKGSARAAKRLASESNAPASGDAAPAKHQQTEHVRAKVISSGIDRSPLSVAEALKNPRFPLILITSFVQGWANMGMRVGVTPLLAATIVAGPSWAPPGPWLAGGALTAFALGNVLALTRSGSWADSYGRRAVVILGLVLSGVFTLTIGFSTSTVALLVLTALGGLGSGFVQPAQQGALADIVGKRQGGRVVSVFQQAGDLGQILGPIMAGLLIDYSGFSAAYIAAGTMLLLAGVAWIFFGKERTDGKERGR